MSESEGAKENARSRHFCKGLGNGQWEGERRCMPGVPACTIFTACLWQTEVLHVSKKNTGIKDELLAMVIRLLLQGDPQESCAECSLRGTACSRCAATVLNNFLLCAIIEHHPLSALQSYQHQRRDLCNNKNFNYSYSHREGRAESSPGWPAAIYY